MVTRANPNAVGLRDSKGDYVGTTQQIRLTVIILIACTAFAQSRPSSQGETTPKTEFVTLAFAASCGILSGIFAHNAEVTPSTYWWGLVLTAGAGLSLWIRLRPRDVPILRSLRIAANWVLVAVGFELFLYSVNMIGWFK